MVWVRPGKVQRPCPLLAGLVQGDLDASLAPLRLQEAMRNGQAWSHARIIHFSAYHHRLAKLVFGTAILYWHFPRAQSCFRRSELSWPARRRRRPCKACTQVNRVGSSRTNPHACEVGCVEEGTSSDLSARCKTTCFLPHVKRWRSKKINPAICNTASTRCFARH